MKIIERIAFALLVLGSAFASKACGQSVALDSNIASQLDALARDSVEHVACLYGFTKPGVVALTDVVFPRQTPIGTHNASASIEDCFAALALWHNHPVPKDSTAPDYLYYSFTDEHSFVSYSTAMIALVGVPGVMCSWNRTQVQDGLGQHLLKLPPVHEQCTPVQ